MRIFQRSRMKSNNVFAILMTSNNMHRFSAQHVCFVFYFNNNTFCCLFVLLKTCYITLLIPGYLNFLNIFKRTYSHLITNILLFSKTIIIWNHRYYRTTSVCSFSDQQQVLRSLNIIVQIIY